MLRSLVFCAVVLGAASGASVASEASGALSSDLEIAIMRDNSREITTLLLRGKVDASQTDKYGQPPLVKALRQESWRAAEVLLLAPKIDVNAATPQGETALMLAAIKGRLDWVEKLIQLGADINQPNWTALHYAASADLEQTMDIVRLLLEKHAYIDAASPNGSTPLMLAAQYSSQEVVELLLQEGADLHQRNHLGLSAVDFARRSERQYLIDYLEQRWTAQPREKPSW